MAWLLRGRAYGARDENFGELILQVRPLKSIPLFGLPQRG
jgi:hypothetical protein